MSAAFFRALAAHRSRWIATLAACSALAAGHAALATPAPAVQFTDGNVLNVQAIVGTGSDSAYEAFDFSDGTAEAFQYNFNGSVNGYQMLEAIESATTLRDDDTYYASFGEHLFEDFYDGSHITTQYPDLYYAPPATGDTPVPGPQGITYAYSDEGLDDLSISNGEILAWDTYQSGAPVLPETAVPEPATLSAAALAGALLLHRHRRRAG